MTASNVRPALVTAIASEESPVNQKGMNPDGMRRKPSVLLSRTTVNQNTRNALRSLVEHEMLAEFWTTFTSNPDSLWNSFLPNGLRKQLARRKVTEAPAHLVRGFPWREMIRLALRGTPVQNLLCSGERPFSILRMTSSFDRRVAQRVRELRPDMVYANEGGGLQTYREAKRLGVTIIHEQPSSYWRWTRDLFANEAERSPDYASILPDTKTAVKYAERYDEELRLVDYVFVPSEHVWRTLAGVVPNEKMRMVPYGAPEVKRRQKINDDPNAPLKVLFVGNLGQHKGIGYLLEAMDLLGGQAELTLVGRRLRPNPRVDEACRRWRWIETLPHDGVIDLMLESDVLVLPSLSDAFGLVVTEALACGLAVIVTPNTGASEIIRDGREGYVVPIRRADIIASRLEALYSDRTKLAEMSRRAQQTAEENSWENYRTNWVRMIRSLECN